jgi:hypothetical protein
MTDDQQLAADFVELRNRIQARHREAAAEAERLARVDISSSASVRATELELKWRELNRKVDDLVIRAGDLLR